MRKIKLAYLVTHPIQYQAPMLERISRETGIDLTVFFCSDISVRQFRDPAFNRVIKWDVPLLKGYRHVFLSAMFGTNGISLLRPVNFGLMSRLRRGKFDVLWVHGYARPFHLLSMLLARLHGIRVLIRDEATGSSKRRGPIAKFGKRLFFMILRALSDGFLAIGTLNRRYYRKLGVPADRIFLTPYSVDNAFFQSRSRVVARSRENFRSSLSLAKDRAVILFAAKLIERKRPFDLLNAYAGLSPDGVAEPRPYLLFVGEGKLRRPLEERAARLGWRSVRFLGFQNQRELPRFYDLCDVFVLPSIEEPWGLVVNEAMNFAKPIIVSDRVGCGPDLVKNGVNGFIFRAGKVRDLRRSLNKVLGRADQGKAMGRKSFAVINSWGFAEDVNGLRRAISNVLSQKLRPRRFGWTKGRGRGAG